MKFTCSVKLDDYESMHILKSYYLIDLLKSMNYKSVIGLYLGTSNFITDQAIK